MTPAAVVLDSSVWIEILGSGPLSKICEKERVGASLVIVPTLVFYEVYRKICSMLSEDQALAAVAAMAQHEVLDLTQDVALTAADLSLQHDLGMADSLILAHAKLKGATLVTLDNDFSGIPGVKIPRKK